MFAQVAYILKFIMTDSEDELMLIFCFKCRFCGKQPKTCAGRASGGRRPAGRQYQTYLIPPADVVRPSARRTTHGRCHDFWNSHNRCPADTPRRPTMTGRCKIGRPAGLVSSLLKD